MERIINNINKKIILNIKEPGIYSMGNQSGTGKTFLINMLSNEEDITTITYEQEEIILLKIEEFKKSNNKLLFIDRFDMIINNKIVEKLKMLNDRYIILDYKNDDYNKLLDARHIVLLQDRERIILNA